MDLADGPAAIGSAGGQTDRCTDALMSQTRQQPLRCTGIAALKPAINFNIVCVQQRAVQGVPAGFREEEGQT